MRHLFVELPYFTAEFLNIWMQEDDNSILDDIYEDWAGTAGQVPALKEFYQKVKDTCPETVFHGTDVGHQYGSTGNRFLQYLEKHELGSSEYYSLAQEAIAQGTYFVENGDDIYRENKMTENFIREYDSLNNENVMGIYGAAHTDPDAMDFTGAVPSMANQLQVHYGDIIHWKELKK